MAEIRVQITVRHLGNSIEVDCSNDYDNRHLDDLNVRIDRVVNTAVDQVKHGVNA